MKRRSLILIFLIAVIFIAASAIPITAGAQATKIAYVDIDYALNNVPEGIKARETLERELKEKKDILDKQEQDIIRFGEEIKNQASVLSEEAKAQKVKEYYQKRADYQKTYVDFQRSFQERELELTKDILSSFQSIIEDLGKSGGYSMILEKSASSILYAPEKVNLTNELVKRYNARHKKK